MAKCRLDSGIFSNRPRQRTFEMPQIAQTGQVLQLVSDLGPAAVFVMGEIAYEMQTRFNLPMSAHQLQQRL